MMTDYIISFDIYPIAMGGSYNTILRGTSTSRNCCNMGDRNPLIFFDPSSFNIVFTIITSTGAQTARSTTALPSLAWSTVKISVIGSTATISANISSNTIFTMTTAVGSRQQVLNQIFYASDTFYTQANAKIRNVRVSFPATNSGISSKNVFLRNSGSCKC